MAALILAITVAALCVLMITSSRVSNAKAQSRLQMQKAFYIAEGGLDFALSQLTESPTWPLAATGRFPALASDGTLTSGWIPLGDGSGDFRMVVNYQTLNSLPDDWDSPGLPDDFQPMQNVPIANRASSSAIFDRVQITVTGRYAQSQRTVSANVRFESNIFRSAIVSDSPALSTSNGSGKGAALDYGHVSFSGGNQYVFGGIHANGKIVADAVGQVSSGDLATVFESYTGALKQELYGTDEEIPDFTEPGSPDQLFEFGRFRAAAAAGCGQIISGLDAFAAACDDANDAGAPLEGIIYLEIDAAHEGNNPQLNMRDGININGTLVFDFTNPPDKFYKVFIKCPININAATLPTDFDPANPAHHLSGYPAVVSSGKDPRGFAIGSGTYDDFAADADMPALMFNTGTVDIHDKANICGAVYGPSFIEIENKTNNLQYFNGTILGGSGVYLQGKTGNGAAQVFVYDPSAVNTLPTLGGSGTQPAISGYMIGE